MLFAGMRWAFAGLWVLLFLGCNMTNKDSDKSGVCIHSLKKIPYNAGCTAPSGAAHTPYEYCTNETKEADCINLSTSCSTTGAAREAYDDVITYYDDKKCETAGYPLSCASNNKNKVADTNFCPP